MSMSKAEAQRERACEDCRWNRNTIDGCIPYVHEGGEELCPIFTKFIRENINFREEQIAQLEQMFSPEGYKSLVMNFYDPIDLDFTILANDEMRKKRIE